MSSSVPGLNLPTQQAMLAGNPRDSAIAAQNANTAKLTALNNAVSGGFRRSKRRKSRRKLKSKKNKRMFRGKSRKNKRKRHHYRRGDCMDGGVHAGGADATTTSGTITVPQFTMPYTPTGGPGQNPNALIQQNSQISTQSSANASYDKYASQKGGYIYRKKRSSYKA